MYPIVLGQLNLLRSIRHQFANLVFVGIIPSQKNEGEPKNLDAYLEVLVDELILFITYECDWKIYDDYQKASFHLKVKILVYILDYQNLGKLFSLTATQS